jgi:hypothetical protein
VRPDEQLLLLDQTALIADERIALEAEVALH